MADPYIGDIRMFAGTFAPQNYALCDGQMLHIMDNTALFSLIATTYGGDGRITFALPDMRSRVPVSQGTGPGLPPARMGYMAGVENVTLNADRVASHTHAVQCANKSGSLRSPVGAYPANEPVGMSAMYSNQTPDADSKWPDVPSAGTSSPKSHVNVQPILCLNFIIALQGVYPSRS